MTTSAFVTSWKKAPLGDVVDILDSRRIPVNSEERNKRVGEVPYYGATGQVGWIDRHLFDEELILLGEDGAPFLDSAKPKAYLVRGKSWVNNHAHVLRGKPGLLNSFLLYQLNCIDYQPFVSGTTRLKLPQGPMKQIPLFLPEVDQQRQIVAEIEKQFTRLEAGVAGLRRVQANLKRYRAAILKAACEGKFGLDIASSDDPIAEDHNGRSSLPRGWKWVPLCVLCNFTQGIQVPISEQRSERTNEDVRFLRIIDFTQKSEDPRYVSYPGARYEVQEQDLSMVRYGASTGFVCTGLAGVIANNLFKIIPKERGLSQKYLFHVLSSVYVQSPIRSQVKGAAMPAVSFEILKPILVPMCREDEQQRTVLELERRLSVVEELEAVVNANLQRATRLHQSILQRAFGENLHNDGNRVSATSTVCADDVRMNTNVG